MATANLAPGRPRYRRPTLDLRTPAHPDRNLRSIDPRLDRDRRGLPREKAPRPYPIRDWATMDAALPQWDRDAFEDALVNTPDTLHRDQYTVQQHLDAWDFVHAEHLWAREHNPGHPGKTGLWLFSAPMGEGKTLSMGAIGLGAWMFRAVPVYSNMSLRYGYQISGAQIFNIMERAEPGSIIIIDEIAALMDQFGGNANRIRNFVQSMTAFRKKGALMLAGSANEAGVSINVKIHADGIIQPYRASQRVRLDHGSVPATARDLPYPPFCYLRHLLLAVPWQGKRVITDTIKAIVDDAYGKASGRNANSNVRVAADLGKFHRYIEMPPGIYDLTARVSDTLDRVPFGDAFDITRDEVTAERQAARRGESGLPGESGEKRMKTIAEIQRHPNAADFLQWYMLQPKTRIRFPAFTRELLVEIAGKHGVRLLKTKCFDELKAAGIKCSKNECKIEDIWAWLDEMESDE